MKNDPVTLTIRPPEADDGSAIAHLFTQLGYPAEGADVTARLLAPDPASAVLLASQADKVVGVLLGMARWLSAVTCKLLGNVGLVADCAYQ